MSGGRFRRGDLLEGTDPGRLAAILDRGRDAVLLLDSAVPGPGCFDLCRIVRAMPDWQHLPILLLTQDVGREFRVAAFEAGADDYLVKPFGIGELLARVAGQLRHTNTRQADDVGRVKG